MKISDIKVGMKFNHPQHGEGMIISKTPKTVSAQFVKGFKAKITYKSAGDNFNFCHF